MNFLREVVDHGRRVAVDVLHNDDIEKDSPFSPEVPDDLREWLPDIYDRFPVVFPWSKPEPVDPALHTVWILDNTAFRTPQHGDHRPALEELRDPNDTQPRRTDGQPVRGGSGWEVEFVACYFVKDTGKNWASIQAALIERLHVNDKDVATKKRIEARLQAFVDRVLPNRTLRISIDGKEEQTLGPSSFSGISTALHELHIAPPPSGRVQSSPANLPPPFGLPNTTVFAEETGWGIISDIDDTIKVTQTPNPLGILRNTFINDPEAVDGMPELYSHLKSVLADPPFFYLSASPYNLYPFLRSFRDAYYPPGTLVLRDASWQNLGGLITSLQENTQAYKDDRMTKIQSWFPHRRFICIGDSTQSDPEAYAQAAKRYPGWIRAVFIRKVTGIAGMDERSKNAPDRFEKAFKGLPRGLWHVFTDPAEVSERIEELASDGDAFIGDE